MNKPQFLIMSDFDGVIADSERSFFSKMNKVLRNELGFNKDDASFRRALSGYAGQDAYDIIEDMLDDAQKASFPQVWADGITPLHDDREMTTIDGMKELYQKLADAAEVQLSTVSNSGHANLQMKVDKLSLRGIFQQAVHSFEDSPSRAPKPSPAPYEYGAAIYGFSKIEKSNVIVIEDSVPGAQAGVAAGAYTIGFVDITERSADDIEERRQALLTQAGVDEVCVGADELQAALERKFGISLDPAITPQAPANDPYVDPQAPSAFG